MVKRITSGLAVLALAISFGTEANGQGKVLSNQEFTRLLVGRVLAADRRLRDRMGRSVDARVYLIFRPDRSFLYKCEVYSIRSSAWTLCPGQGLSAGIKGWFNGIWAFEGGSICARASKRNYRDRSCYRWRQIAATQFFAEVTKERKAEVTTPGRWTLLPETRPSCVGKIKSGSC
jgi:hypothetical protein